MVLQPFYYFLFAGRWSYISLIRGEWLRLLKPCPPQTTVIRNDIRPQRELDHHSPPPPQQHHTAQDSKRPEIQPHCITGKCHVVRPDPFSYNSITRPDWFPFPASSLPNSRSRGLRYQNTTIILSVVQYNLSEFLQPCTQYYSTIIPL